MRSRPTVLVVDPSDHFRQTVGARYDRVLDLTFVFNGETALCLVDEGHRYDAIICSAELAPMTWRTLHEHLRARSPEQASRFVVTGEVPPTGAETLGWEDRWLEQPFSTERLVGVIATARAIAARSPTRRPASAAG